MTNTSDITGQTNRLAPSDFVAFLGSITVIMLWMSPIPPMFTSQTSIFRTRSASSLGTAFGFVAGFGNCILWMMYMYNRLDKMAIPFIVNFIGSLFQASFVVCYWYFSTGKQRSDVKKQIIAVFLFVVSAVVTWIALHENTLMGYFAMVLNILMLFGPLAGAGVVIRTRSRKGLIFSMLVLTLVTSSLWFLYGCMLNDLPIMVPNFLGMVFGLVQLALFAWAKPEDHQQQQQQQGWVALSESTTIHGQDELQEDEEEDGGLGQPPPVIEEEQLRKQLV